MKNILVVDDAPDMRHLLIKGLGKYGYNIESAINISEAKQKLSNQTPDLILLDIMMPGMYGTTWCEQLKLDERTKKIPIIIISSKDRSIDKEIGELVQADAYITKPFKMAEVLEIIEKFIT